MSASDDSAEPPTKRLKSEQPAGLVEASSVSTISSGQTETQTFLCAGTTSFNSMFIPRPVIPYTTGNIRPSLNITSAASLNESQLTKLPNSEMGPKKSPSQLSSSTIAIPIHQNWSADGKVTFQFQASNAGKTTQPKSPVNFGNVIVTNIGTRYSAPQVVTIHNNRLTSPTSTLSKPVVSADMKGQFHVQSKPSSNSDAAKTGTSTQFSFQVPVNWNVAGTKSLLDTSGKMSVVAFNAAEGKSLLSDKKTVSSDMLTSQSAIDNQTVMTVVKHENLPKTLVAGSAAKVIATLPGQILTSTTLISVPRNTGAINTSSIPQKITKQGSYIISNKQYTIVPANSSQILKSDSKPSKTKITMAEAQIMLPSGPAKISWPIQQQQFFSTLHDSSGKQILTTTPVMKPGTLPTGKSVASNKPVVTSGITVTTVQYPKMSASNGNPIQTAKVVEVRSAGNTKTVEVNAKSNGSNISISNSKPGTPVKTTVLATQKSWELVKQSSQLLPPSKTETPVTVLPAETKMETSASEASSDNKSEVTVFASKGKSLLSNEETMSDSVESESVQIKPEQSAKLETDEKPPEIEEKPSEKDDSGDKNDETSLVCNEEMIPNDDTNMETSDVPVSDSKVSAKPHSQDDSKEDFDPVDALEWKDGIGELPGSNLKFRMNDLGVLDVVDHDLECTETLNTSNESETVEPDSKMEVSEEVEVKKEPMDDEPVTVKQEPSQQEVSNKDEITQCENCGEYGFATDFYKDGRFCSQTCVGAFDSKRMRGVKKQGTMSKMVLGLKKGRKKFLLKDSLNRDKDQLDAASKKSKAFVWTRYLEKENATEAPARLFKNPFPSTKNNFRVGMKVEGVDPNHQSLFCVLTVVEVAGYRIRLHFDGYSECFDFWSDIDSPYIYPIGFCEKNNRVLQPPKGFTMEEFNWTSYLKMTKSTPAPKSLFSNQPVQPVTPNLFRVGSKLEAVDKKNSSLICVASVRDTLGDKVLIHFDSWDDNYDYWCDMTAPYIHPCGFCDDKGYVLSPPIDWKDPNGFTWERFLAKTKTQAVPARAFKSRPMVGFEPGMKVEVVDKRNPLLVRVASIMEVETFMVKVHFDGWSDIYDYWLDDDSPDIHPPGWCAKTGHPLVPPIGPSDLVVTSGPGVCPTPGCKGIGHIKGPKYSGHHSTFGCPYSEINMNKESVLGDRLSSYGKSEDSSHRLEDNTERKLSTNHEVSNNATGKAAPTQKMPTFSKMMGQENGVPPKKFGRGRRPKSYYLELEEQRRAREREQERQEKEENLRQGIHNSVFSSAMIPTPKTEVPLCWDQHSKLLPGVTNIRGNDVGRWTIDEVAGFVNTLPGCEEQAKLFQEQQIDGEAFLLLTQADIVKIMNIKLGPALKIFNSIVMFKNSIEV